MAVELQRGGNVSLNKVAPGLNEVAIGLGWDAATSGAPVDIDVSAFLVDANGKVPDDAHFIFFNNLTSPDGAVQHMGNNKTGIGSGDDEVILVNLPQVAANVDRIAITLTIYEAEERGQTFGAVQNAFIRVLNRNSLDELVRYNLSEEFPTETALVFGELYRRNDEWKFRAVGQGFSGGLQTMADTFGVDTGDDDEEEAAAPATPTTSPPTGPTATQGIPEPTPIPVAPMDSVASPAPTPTTSLDQVPTLQKDPRSTVDYELLYPGAFTLLKVKLAPGEGIKAESGAMVAQSDTIDIEGKLEGGIMGGLGRMLSGESFFFQTLKAARGPGEALLGTPSPGDIQAIIMDGSVPYVVQKDGFFAGSMELEVSTKMQNLVSGFASGEGFFVIKVSGAGTLFVSSYGAIHPIDLGPGEEMIVDNGHLVAWPESMNYSIESASSGFISTFTSGEVIVCRFRGPGRVLIQSKNPAGFGGWLGQLLGLSGGGGGGGIVGNALGGNL